MKRLSKKALVRMLAVLVVYIVMVRLHVFRKYHLLEPFGHNDIGHFSPNDSRLQSLDRIDNGSDIVGYYREDEDDSTWGAESLVSDYAPDAPWQTDMDLVFQDNDSMVLNLDSRQWHEEENSTNMHEAIPIINQSHRSFMQCGNDVTHTFRRQPMRHLLNVSDSIVIGDVDLNITNYAVFGIGLDSFDNPRAVSYLFYPPLSALAWKRIGYGTIVIIADTLDSWMAKPLHRHVMRYLCNIQAVVVFFPVPQEKAVMISQMSRMFAHVMMKNLLRLQGAPPEYDPYIVTADSDLWPFKRDMFPSDTGTYQDVMPDIISLNHGCCAWFVHRSIRQKMYPMTYVRMRLSTWTRFLKIHADITDMTALTLDDILNVLRVEFGSLVDDPVIKGQNDGWFMDQHLMSYWLNKYRELYGNDKVMFGNRQGMRLDRIQWPERVSRVTFDYTFDVHLPKLKAGPSWPRVLVLLEFMYGADSDQFKWCVRYKNKFVSYLPPELLVVQI